MILATGQLLLKVCYCCGFNDLLALDDKFTIPTIGNGAEFESPIQTISVAVLQEETRSPSDGLLHFAAELRLSFIALVCVSAVLVNCQIICCKEVDSLLFHPLRNVCAGIYLALSNACCH